MSRWIAKPAPGILKTLCARWQPAAIVGGDTREPSGMRRASNTRRSGDEGPEPSASNPFDRQWRCAASSQDARRNFEETSVEEPEHSTPQTNQTKLLRQNPAQSANLMPGCTTKLAGNRHSKSSIKRQVTFAKLILSSSRGNCGRTTQPFLSRFPRCRDLPGGRSGEDAGYSKGLLIWSDCGVAAPAAMMNRATVRMRS